jgi:hypothetical protein
VPSRGTNVFVEDVLEARPGHRRCFRIHKQLRYENIPPNGQPCPEVGHRFFPEWKTSFLSALAENANARRSLEGYLLQWKAYEFRDSKPAREAQMQHRAVADAETSCGVRRVEYGAHFFGREMAHLRLIMAFGWNGMYLPHLLQNGRRTEFYVSHERFDGCESTVACNRAIAALFFNVSEKIEDQRSVDLFNEEL